MRRQYLWFLGIISSSVLISLALVGKPRLCAGIMDAETPSALPSDSFFFRLEVAGQETDDYSECFGLGSSHEIEEDIAKTDAGVLVKRKTPGVLEWHDITLKRKTPSGAFVVAWRQTVENGHFTGAIRNGAITMFSADSAEPLARWEFRNGWPACLNFEGSVEELVIVHDGLERVGLPNNQPRGRPDRDE